MFIELRSHLKKTLLGLQNSPVDHRPQYGFRASHNPWLPDPMPALCHRISRSFRQTRRARSGDDVVEKSLVVRDDDHRTIRAAKGRVHSLGHTLQGINVQSGIGFVQDASLGSSTAMSKMSFALLLSARKTFIHRPVDEALVISMTFSFVRTSFRKSSHRVRVPVDACERRSRQP